MPHTTEIHTSRLILRQWRTEDRPPFAQMHADAEVMTYFPRGLNRAESDAMVDRFQSLIAERGWGMWAVTVKENATFIGCVGLHIPEADLPFQPCTEIAWRLTPAAWGNGYATEAAQAALSFGFQTLGLNEIVSFTSVQNQRSRQVMERLGMIEDPVMFDHPNVPVDSPMRAHCLYRLSAERYKTQQAAIQSFEINRPKHLHIVHHVASEGRVRQQLGPYLIESLIAETQEGRMTAYHVHIEAQKKTSESYHKIAEELYYVLDGEAVAVLDDETYPLSTGDFLRLPPGTRHRFITHEKTLSMLNIHSPGVNPNRDTYFSDEVPDGFGKCK